MDQKKASEEGGIRREVHGNWSNIASGGRKRRESGAVKKNFLGESAVATSFVATGYPPSPPKRHIHLRIGPRKMLDSRPTFD
jgi:hypothetical protein